MAQLVLKMTCSSSQIIYRNLPEDDPKKRRPDITLANEKLAWAPGVSLEGGLSKTIDYHRGVI